MYTPAFFEVFVGLAALAAWTYWLSGRSHAPRGVNLVLWIVAGLVLLGQVVAAMAVVSAGSTPDAGTLTFVDLGRWGSLAAVLGGATLLAILTAVTLLKGRRSEV